MADKITIAIVGFGNMGRKHFERLQASVDFSVTVVIDNDIEEDFADGIVHLRDYRDFKPDMAAAVLIAVPSFLHCEVGLYFLNLGVHVFMEKPLALSYGDCELLVDACDRVGVVGMVGMVERFNPAFVACHNLLLRFGVVPQRLCVERFNPSSVISDTDVVLDLMVHDLDILLFLLGDRGVESIEILESRDGEYGYDFVAVRLIFAGGIECEVSAGRGTGCVSARRYWVGEWGSGKFGVNFLARELDYFCEGGDDYVGEYGGDGLVGEHGLFARRIRGGLVGFGDGLRVMGLLFEIGEELQKV